MSKIPGWAVFFVLTACLEAQSVAELARLEKVRREGLARRAIAVITNADLDNLRKTAAMGAPTPAPETQQSVETMDETVIPAESESEPVPAPSQPPLRIQPRVVRNGPALVDAKGSPISASTVRNLEAGLRAVREKIDLLETKLTALQQRFYLNNDMTPQDLLQREIDETFKKLEAARTEEAKLLEEQERLESAPAKTSGSRRAGRY
ncbi:MAG: hypothetical protein ACYDH0_09235 [Candidatus Aminicenantales bacterium]